MGQGAARGAAAGARRTGTRARLSGAGRGGGQELEQGSREVQPFSRTGCQYAQARMPHPVLIITSLCMIIPQFAAVFTFGGPLILQWSYLSGPSISVWNQGTTNRLAMWSDRIMMTVGCTIDFYFMSTLHTSQAVQILVLTITAVTAYVVAKYITGGARAISAEGKIMTWAEVNPWATMCHIVAHTMVSILHYSMLYFISQNRQSNHGQDEDTQRFPLTRCLALAAGVMPLLLYFVHVLDRMANGSCERQAMDSMPGMIRSLWVFINAIFWVPLIGVPCMFCICVTPLFGLSVAQRLIWHCACVYFKIILWASAVSLEIIGLENLDPHLNYFFACNHVSTYDIPVIFSALPYWLISVSKWTVAYIPIFGWSVWLGGSIFVQRSNHAKSIDAMNKGLDSLRKRPKSVLLFPEGRRSDNGTLQEFKRGGFMLAIQCKMPVVPVALIGTEKIAGRSFSSLIQPIRPSHVTVVIGKPVETKSMDVGDRDDLASSIHTGI